LSKVASSSNEFDRFYQEKLLLSGTFLFGWKNSCLKKKAFGSGDTSRVSDICGFSWLLMALVVGSGPLEEEFTAVSA